MSVGVHGKKFIFTRAFFNPPQQGQKDSQAWKHHRVLHDRVKKSKKGSPSPRKSQAQAVRRSQSQSRQRVQRPQHRQFRRELSENKNHLAVKAGKVVQKFLDGQILFFEESQVVKSRQSVGL